MVKEVELSISDKTTVQKMVETGFLVITWVGMGLYLEIYGPTLIDLKLKTSGDYEQIATAISGRGVGVFVGCVVCGILIDKFLHFCHTFIAVALDIAAIVTVVAPWSPGVEVLWVCCAVGGFAEVVIGIAGQKRVLCIWLEKAPSPMYLVHMGYGVGSFLVPLFANPFLAVARPVGDLNLTNYTSNDSIAVEIRNNSVMPAETNVPSTEPSRYIKQSRIEYPYAISASYVAIMSMVFYYYQVQENRAQANYRKSNVETNPHILDLEQFQQDKTGDTPSRSFRDLFNPSSCTRGDAIYGIQIFVVTFLFLGNAGGGERMIGSFIRTFSVDQLGFSGDEASYINSAFWISFTAGRFAFFVSAQWIGIRKLLLIQTTFIASSTILMNIFAADNSIAFWILLQALGFFLSAMWPSIVTWTDYHLELTGVGMMIIVIGNSVGGICHMRLIGYLYNEYGPRTFLYQTVGYGILALVLAVVLTIIGRKHGNRFKWDVRNETQSEDTSCEREKSRFKNRR